MADEKKLGCMVRHVDDMPVEYLEGIRMVRVLAGTGFLNVGCEHVVLKKGQRLEPHVHEQAHSCVLILSGSVLVDLEGEQNVARQGHVIYIPPKASHGFDAVYEDVVLYGFQSPPIVQAQDDVDIRFEGRAERSRLTS